MWRKRLEDWWNSKAACRDSDSARSAPDSFSTEVDAPPLAGRFHAVFIRAPRLAPPGPQVEIVARRLPEAGGEAVGVRQGKVVGLCFHPELTSDTRFHRWFLTEVAGLDLRSPASPERVPLTAATRDAS